MTTTRQIFLVEDDIPVQFLLDTVLTDAGFDVVVAGNGMQALAELETHAPRFGALITDINLGAGPDGWAVSRRARDLVPDLPVVYITGGNAYEWPSKGVSKSVLLTKPFAWDRLITTLSALLTAPTPAV